MLIDHWPLFGLRLRTPRLELRLPGPEELGALADLAVAGVHDPTVQPFAVAWTDAEPEQRARNVVQWHWQLLGKWSPEDWSLQFVTLVDGRVIGTQEIGARDFATVRQVATGSWLGRGWHGQGYGTEMRAAVLHLAFAGLGALDARSDAFEDNHSSYAVSRKLGYTDDGIERMTSRGRPIVSRRVRLTRPVWQATHRIPVDIDGLDPCLPMFGV